MLATVNRCRGWWVMGTEPGHLQKQSTLTAEPSLQPPKPGAFPYVKRIQLKAYYMDTWLEDMQSVACTCRVFRAKANIKLCIQHGRVPADTPRGMLRYEGVFGHHALENLPLLSLVFKSVWDCVGPQPMAWASGWNSQVFASVGTAILFPSIPFIICMHIYHLQQYSGNIILIWTKFDSSCKHFLKIIEISFQFYICLL